jgi:hypothetical protein
MNVVKSNTGNRYGYYRCPVRLGVFDYAKECGMATYFRADHVDMAVWKWVKSFLIDPTTLTQALRAQQAEREAFNKPLVDRLAVVDDLLADNRAQLDRALDLYLTGDFPRDMLIERQARLQETIAALERERRNMATQLETQILTDEQLDVIRVFADKVRRGLETADADFKVRRRLIEALEVRATLVVENGQKVVYAQCILGEDTLSIASTTS